MKTKTPSPKQFNLIMISAMYENGGNTLHRFFDGHPQLHVYPFESQLGTPLVSDFLTSVFPPKYRWPEFSLSGSIDSDYELIIDEELKRHVKTPLASKFRNADLKLIDSDRKQIFLDLLKDKTRSRRNVVEAFFSSTFNAWKNYQSSGKESHFVGYSPIVGVDAEKIFSDFPSSHIVHIVRNPLAAYSDTKKRPVPYTLSKYVQIWNIVQLMSLNFSAKFPENFHIVRYENLVKSPKYFFRKLVKKIHIDYHPALENPSWNSRKLETLVPWGTIATPSSKSNQSTILELNNHERAEIKTQSAFINKVLGYERFKTIPTL